MVSQVSLSTGLSVEATNVINPGNNLVAGALVRVFGFDPGKNRLMIEPAIADRDGPVATLVLLTALGGNGGIGQAYREGRVDGLNTAAGSAGAPVYLDAATAGGWTLVEPTGTNTLRQIVGRVLVAAAAGSIYFDLQDESAATQPGSESVVDLFVSGDALFAAASRVGFYGAGAQAQGVSGADLTNNVTVGGVDDTIADFADLAVYANSAAAIRNDIYQLARKLKQVNDALRDYGLLT